MATYIKMQKHTVGQVVMMLLEHRQSEIMWVKHETTQCTACNVREKQTILNIPDHLMDGVEEAE